MGRRELSLRGGGSVGEKMQRSLVDTGLWEQVLWGDLGGEVQGLLVPCLKNKL